MRDIFGLMGSGFIGLLSLTMTAWSFGWWVAIVVCGGSKSRVAPTWPPKPESDLEILCGNEPPYLIAKSNYLYSTRRTLQLGIRNAAHAKPISNIKVEVVGIEPWTGRNGPWILKEGMAIAASDIQYIPLVTRSESNKPNSGVDSDDIIELVYKPPNGGMGPQLPTTPSVLTIRATGFDCPARESRFKVWANEQGRMQIASIP